MLISHVTEDEAGWSGAIESSESSDDHAAEYRTASELFDHMARNHNFQSTEDENLTTRDLILLYKNIDLGTKLMSNVNEFKIKSSNQYVETIVYEELDSDSDLGEIFSNEDIHNMMLFNKERIDLLNNPPPLENKLCHKLSNMEFNTSDLAMDFDRNFVFNDPFLKDQLKNLNFISNSNKLEATVLPASLLDYICCKRLEDNYNFYMDNIIRHVKHTIDQLKRISNGDYLTDKAKEKWREVDNTMSVVNNDVNSSKVLSNTTNIPLYVERKVNGAATKWDDLVHSDVDIRSISKILEKKIVVEVPKTICGSYKLFSKCCNDNLIIRCKRRNPALREDTEGSRVDVILQLDRSESGHVISNISSIMILQKKPADTLPVLPLPYKEIKNTADVPPETISNSAEIIKLRTECIKESVTIKEIDNDRQSLANLDTEDRSTISRKSSRKSRDRHPPTNDLEFESNEFELTSMNADSHESSDSNFEHYSTVDNNNFALTNRMSLDEFRLTIQKLNMQASLQEEDLDEGGSVVTSNKKRSPTRNRIKSPYENKSHLLEEKKRKKLLEIRQKREKKKIALSEKLNKHKYQQKGVVSPHNASSITKLSISNKSFYDSIYGQPGEDKLLKLKGRRDKKDFIPESLSENDESVSQSQEPNNATNREKYINKSYYLDDTVTEMMYMEMKKNERKKNNLEGHEQCSERSSSAVSNDMNTNFNILTQLITPAISRVSSGEPVETTENFQGFGELILNKNEIELKEISLHQPEIQKVPENTPKNANPKVQFEEDQKKVCTSVDFRKSIDKIYELINKLGKNESSGTNQLKSKFTAVERTHVIGGGETSTVQCSDSGTSVKHHVMSSNPSCYSFEKSNNPEEVTNVKNTNVKPASMPAITVVPKVIISAKSQTPKAANVVGNEKNKKERKKQNPNTFQSDNPLRAISQLLHEFDNVQKIRSKTSGEPKVKEKKPEVNFADMKTENRQIARRPSRLENHLKDKESQDRPYKVNVPKERKVKLSYTTEPSRFLSQSSNIETKPPNRVFRKKVVDIVDEMKEARGEAVRGPSKPNARLNSLAQPKRTYVQAQIEEFQAKYGKSIVTDRLQKLTGAPPTQTTDKTSPTKHRRKNDGSPTYKHSPSPPPVLERSTKKPTNHHREVSPTTANDQSTKQSNVFDAPNFLKKKMVESYVKNHYGRSSSSSDTNDLLKNGQKSRVPFFPNDIDILSLSSNADESSKIGFKIHHIIDTMITTPPPLTVVTECNESTSNPAKEDTEDTSFSDNYFKPAYGETNNPLNLKHESKFHDISAGDNVNMHGNPQLEDTVDNSIAPQDEEINIKMNPSGCQNSMTEIAKLESALHGHMPGTLHKRLRLKNLTLTPKQSLQRVLLLQSGDANSMLVNSSISHTIRSSSSDRKLEIGILPELSNFDWNFAKFPMQIATVGYCFPQFQKTGVNSNANNCFVNDTNTQETDSTSKSNKSDKTSQCFKGGQEILPENAIQVEEFIAISSIVKINSAAMIEQKNEMGLIPIVGKGKDTVELITEKYDIEPFIKPQELNVATKISCTAMNKNNEKSEQLKEDSIMWDNVKSSPKKETPKVEYTTSLDILVGLLNEIQKITTCQTQIATNEGDQNNEDQQLELETILKGATALENVKKEARNIISISSLDKLRQLDSNASIYSFYLSNNGENEYSDKVLKPLFADKEVNVMIPEREYVHRCTEVPSRLLPITVNNATETSNSLIGILSEPSSQSMFTYNEIPLHPNASLTSIKKIISLSKDKFATKIEFCCQEINSDKEGKTMYQDEVNKDVLPVIQKRLNIEECGRCSEMASVLELRNPKMDPIIKMKRDILVTMYSVLVFTVFAALSFPEMLYQGNL